jgi:hypothetical protein
MRLPTCQQEAAAPWPDVKMSHRHNRTDPPISGHSAPSQEAVARPFFSRMLPVMRNLSRAYRVDLVFLNNASTDETLTRI